MLPYWTAYVTSYKPTISAALVAADGTANRTTVRCSDLAAIYAAFRSAD
jgi:hypothetical protein